MIKELTNAQAARVVEGYGIPFDAVEDWSVSDGRLAIRYLKTGHDDQILRLPDGQPFQTLSTVLNIPESVTESATP
jgi:hypothetical protein